MLSLQRVSRTIAHNILRRRYSNVPSSVGAQVDGKVLKDKNEVVTKNKPALNIKSECL